MEYRELGRTGMRVSEVGFGCGNVGGLLVRGSEAEQVQAVKRAIELGINYFDTAPAYGDGRSEAHLGPVLRQLDADVFVATKFRVAPEELADIPGAVKRSLEASLGRLQRDQVDVLQLHNRVTVAREDRGGSLGVADVLGPGGVADALEKVRAEGMVRFVGFTGLGEAEALRQVVVSGRFDVVQAYYNLLNPSAGVAVPPGFYGQDFNLLMEQAANAGMGVVAIRVMAGGALAGDTARQGHASPSMGGAMAGGADYDRDYQRAQAISSWVTAGKRTPPQAAVRFALDSPLVSAALVGFSSVAQVEEAVACSGSASLEEATLAALRELWATDFGLPSGSP